MKPVPGTYALILQCYASKAIQVGRWGQLDLQPGYYIYVGSAFGAGGVRARVSRHLRTEARKHWHIDFLRAHVRPVEARISYEAEHLEHEWAGILLNMPGMTPIRGFGCSDCKCYSHLFFSMNMPEGNWGSPVEVKQFFPWPGSRT